MRIELKKLPVDVVGPVCESGDFLGKDRFLQIPDDSDDNSSIYMAVMDVGAYCSSMSSNYNLHPRPAEVFIEESEAIDGSISTKYILTRHPDSLDDILSSFTDYN